MSKGEKNSFNEKGDAAEELIANLCQDAFFADFCFKNPYYAPGKELCDVLVVLGDVAIIWQIKNLKLGTNGIFKQSEIDKALKQCRGTKRKLKSMPSITLKNLDGNDKTIDVSAIKEYFMVAAIEGGQSNFGTYYDKNSKGDVHIFFDKFTRFATKHLNTVSDFVQYLRAKEELLNQERSLTISGGEENLLAVFLKNARTFGNLDQPDATAVYFDGEGAAEEFEEHDDYKAKIKADRWSEGWDELIQKKREGVAVEGEHDDVAARDKFLAKMMGHNRLERRSLGKIFFEAAVIASEGPKVDNFVYRRLVPCEGVTYVFTFMGDEKTSKEMRRAMLEATCLAARQKVDKNSMVIGLVTEREMVRAPSCSYDWVLVDIDNEEFEERFGESVRQMRKKLGLWANPSIVEVTEHEYPNQQG